MTEDVKPKSSDELAQLVADKDNAIKDAKINLNIVQEALYAIKKQWMELAEVARQARYLLSRLRTERVILKDQFWASSGR